MTLFLKKALPNFYIVSMQFLPATAGRVILTRYSR